MALMVVLCNSGLDMVLCYMAYCPSPNIDWPRYTLSWTFYDLSIGEVSDVPWRSASSTVAVMQMVRPLIIVFHHLPFSFSTRRPHSITYNSGAEALVAVWVSPVWDNCLNWTSKVPEFGDFDLKPADVESVGDRDLLDFVRGLDFGDRACALDDYDLPQGVYWTVNLSLRTFVLFVACVGALGASLWGH